MTIKKGYKNYKSYQYLEEGKDYKSFKLALELDRVPEYLLPLSSEEEKRAEKIARDFIYISLHEHVHIYPDDLSKFFLFAQEGREITAYEALAHSNLDCVFDNLADFGIDECYRVIAVIVSPAPVVLVLFFSQRFEACLEVVLFRHCGPSFSPIGIVTPTAIRRRQGDLVISRIAASSRTVRR